MYKNENKIDKTQSSLPLFLRHVVLLRKRAFGSERLQHFSKTLIVIFVSVIVELATTKKGANEIAFVGLATNGRLLFGWVGTGPTLLGLDRIARAKPVATKTRGKKESTMIFWGNRGLSLLAVLGFNPDSHSPPPSLARNKLPIVEDNNVRVCIGRFCLVCLHYNYCRI
jgi:hypothetical protein